MSKYVKQLFGSHTLPLYTTSGMFNFFKNHKKLVLILAVLLSGLAFLIIRRETAPVNVETSIVERRSITKYISASGTTQITNQNVKFSQIAANIEKINFKNGDVVKKGDVILSFNKTSVILSIIGGVAGVVIGTSLSFILDRFITTQINIFYTLIAFGVSAGIGIIFGITPAIKASKLSPIDALRYE